MIVFKNVIYQVLGKIVSMVATAVGISLIAKTLGVEFYGQYIFVITFLAIFFTFSDWGINTVVVKELSGQKQISTEYFTKVFITRVLFAILICLLAFLTSVLFQLSKEVMIGVLVGLPMILGYTVNSTASIIFQAQLKYKFDFIIKAVYSGVSLLALYTVLTNTSSVWIIISTSVLAWLISSFFSIYFIKDYLELKFLKIDYKFSKTLIILALPIGIALIINTLLSQIDKLIIPSLLDFRQAGYYGLSYKGFEFLLVFPTFFVNSIFIILANKLYNKKVFDSSVKILIFTSIVLTFFSIVFASNIIRVLSSQDFSNSILPFQVLSLGLLIFFITALLRLQLIVEKKESLFFYIYFSSFILNLILNILLLPSIGIIGASFATILSEILVLILMIKEVQIVVITKSMLFYINKVVLVCLLAFLPAVFISISSVILKLILTTVLLVIFAYAFGLTRQIITMLKSIEKIAN